MRGHKGDEVIRGKDGEFERGQGYAHHGQRHSCCCGLGLNYLQGALVMEGTGDIERQTRIRLQLGNVLMQSICCKMRHPVPQIQSFYKKMGELITKEITQGGANSC